MRHKAPIYIIDDEEDMCRSLEILLALDGITTRSFANILSFLDMLPHLEKGIIICDVKMPNITGIDLLKMMPDLERSDPIILITGYGNVTLAVNAMLDGAANFIEKPFEFEKLLDVVRHLQKVIDNSAHVDRCFSSLSHREKQVLKLICDGMTSKLIAFKLGISHRTVETYRQNLMDKTGATSLAQLVRFGIVSNTAA